MSVLDVENITPWILGVFGLLVMIMAIAIVRSWRDMKRAPYYFLRCQAEQRLQIYSLVSLVLMGLAGGFGFYTRHAPVPDNTLRVAVLANAKPPNEELRTYLQANDRSRLVQEPAAPQQEVVSTSQDSFTTFVADRDALLEASLTLPEEFDRFEPTVELRQDTRIGSLSFSTRINSEYKAVEPATIFAEGFYTLYATFDYEQMREGMAWAWVWRHDGQVVGGGNEIWKYGSEGPGYIYYNPEEGFQFGDYTLEVWVNNELFTRSAVTMNNAAVSAGN